MPAFHLFVALVLELRFVVVAGWQAGAQAFEVFVSALDMRVDAGGDEGAGEFAEVEDGGEKFFALAGHDMTFDRSDLTQPTQTLVRAAAAGAETGHDLVHAERLLVGKEQAVNLPDRRRQGKRSRRTLENLHALALELVQLGLGHRRGAEIVFFFYRHIAERCRTWSKRAGLYRGGEYRELRGSGHKDRCHSFKKAQGPASSIGNEHDMI